MRKNEEEEMNRKVEGQFTEARYRSLRTNSK